MRIKASCGNAPKSDSLETNVYSLTLTGETLAERRWLAGLYKAVRLFMSFGPIPLRKDIPQLKIKTYVPPKESPK